MVQKLLITTLLFLCGVLPLFAGETVVDIFDVGVDGFIDEDNTSVISLNPTVNEVGIFSDVLVRILDRNNNPISGRSVELFVTGNPSEITLVQPTAVTDSDGYVVGKVKSIAQGTFVVRARDTSFSQDILISDSDTLTVFPIPTPSIADEPYYTKGLSNKIFWSKPDGLSSYTYYIEISKSSNFSTVLKNSRWISELSYTFENLDSEELYYYRIKAKNAGGIESNWSSTVFSTQDDIPPVINYIEIARITSRNIFSGISVKFDVTDNFEILTVKFFCKLQNGDMEECGTMEHSGARYYLNISTDELERGGFGAYLDKYDFCVEGYDKAGNLASNCNFSIEVAQFVDSPVPLFTNLINSIIKVVNDYFRNIGDTLNTLFASSQEVVLQLSSILFYLIIIVISLSILAQSIFVVPTYLLFQAIELMRRIGIKKPGTNLGLVYDAISGKPVRFAQVKVYDGTNNLVTADVTDKNGRFKGNLEVGKYRVWVQRAHYLFPSELYKEYEVPKSLGKLYRGEFFVSSKRSHISLAIPIDPINIYSKFERDFKLERKMIGFLKALVFLFLTFGLAVSAFTFERFPNILNMVLLLMYIPAFGVFLKSVVNLKFR